MPWEILVRDPFVRRQGKLLEMFLRGRLIWRPEFQEVPGREPLPAVPVLELQPLPGVPTLEEAHMGVRYPKSANNRISMKIIPIKPSLDNFLRLVLGKGGSSCHEDMRNNWFSQG